MCSYGVESKTRQIIANFYQVPPNTSNIPGVTNTIYAGFQINQSEMQKWTDVYTNTSIKGSGSDPSIPYHTAPLEMRVQCVQGDPYSYSNKEIPTILDYSNTRNATIRANPSGPTQVIMELPIRNKASQEYNCYYAFQQLVRADYSNPLNPKTIPDKTIDTWKNRGGFQYGGWETSTGGPNYLGINTVGEHILEGVNTFGSIRTTTGAETINPTTLEFKPGNYGAIRNKLAANETSHYITTDPFQQFPTGESLIGTTEEKNRNPLN